MNTPIPPKEFQSCLEYAIATMDVRGAYLDRMFDGGYVPSQDEIRAITQEELEHLKQKAAMPWVGMFENWCNALAEKLGRSAEDILEGKLLHTDFSDAGVRIKFEDGSDLTFRRVFYLGATPSDGSIHRVAVFTEHCGYHEFWIGPGDHIQDVGPLNQNNPHSNDATQVNVWDNMALVGRVFGSSDFEMLMEEDRVEFQAQLSSLIRVCRSTETAKRGIDPTDEFLKDAINVQLALKELGQDVNVGAAAAVWEHYSSGLAASWISGAESVHSAQKALFSYVASKPFISPS